jgi:hypothetical protein
MSFLKTKYSLSNRMLAHALNVDGSTVSKWCSGAREFKDVYTDGLVTFFFAVLGREKMQSLLQSDEGVSDADLKKQFEDILFNGAFPQPHPLPLPPSDPDGDYFLGVRGLFKALSMLARELERLPSESPLNVYISTENCSTLFDDKASELWSYLYAVNDSRPVRLVFEQTRRPERIKDLVVRLLPDIEDGKLDLFTLPSNEHYFCHHMSFLAPKRCMVMTTEPAGVPGACISFCIGSPDFVAPMSKVYEKLNLSARRMTKQIAAPRTETLQIYEYLTDGGVLSAMKNCLSLVYAGESEVGNLLKSQRGRYEKRRLLMDRCQREKALFEQFLENNYYREILPLDMIDDCIGRASMRIPELFFPATGPVPVSLSFIEDVLRGMIESLERFRHLEIALTCGAERLDTSWRVKGDGSILLHRFSEAGKKCVYSEEWSVIGHYANKMEEAYSARKTIRGRRNVMMALQSRIDRIGKQNRIDIAESIALAPRQGFSEAL